MNNNYSFVDISFISHYAMQICYICRIYYISVWFYLPSLSPSQFIKLPLGNKCPVNFRESKINSADNSLISTLLCINVPDEKLRRLHCDSLLISRLSSVSQRVENGRGVAAWPRWRNHRLLVGNHLRDRGEIILSLVL